LPSILFVCTANQFRSPIAAAYFERRLREGNIPGEWRVASAGTWVPGEGPAHPRALESAARLGLDLSAHRTREVTAAILADSDLVVVMQHGHEEALECEFPACRGKTVLLGALVDTYATDIPDPAQSNFTDSDLAAETIAAFIDQSFAELVLRAEHFAK